MRRKIRTVRPGGDTVGRCVAATILAAVCFCSSVFAETGKTSPEEPAHHHHPTQQAASVIRLSETYVLPEVTLVRTDGTLARFPAEIEDGKPVLLNFIYTTCTAVCPLTSQIFSAVQVKLGEERHMVRMVSISIDPEQDTPARLTVHARKYGAGAQWQHYTGTVQASIAMQQAFKVYRGDKMRHTPLTFVRAAPGQPWVRLEGFASADEVVREYRQLTAH